MLAVRATLPAGTLLADVSTHSATAPQHAAPPRGTGERSGRGSGPTRVANAKKIGKRVVQVVDSKGDYRGGGSNGQQVDNMQPQPPDPTPPMRLMRLNEDV